MIDLLPASAVCAQLGRRLRVLRLARNLGQAELAARAGCSLSAVRRLEAQGQGSLELVVRVAQALQAADGLGALFELPAVTSIAQAEAAAGGPVRRRASRRSAGAAK
ncbi:helix-turn-helix transcriptional regulator [Pelomonas sp. P7]|uniref:Helix-turn-helix transcriptional regulator n=1 Tax=Pelomonas caseinilytica TaxID=2906763 RepID=A0ABS8XAW8_9BURK|nr:helix-turn-helix transcriptional regulator [Pelomonas sp. P7]MCE4536467.1 helix-turn-helix transcriptional regulator [Pelomonas sp. P7]